LRHMCVHKTDVWLASDPGAVNYSGNNGTYAFVRGTDGHLYVNFHVSGGAWTWADQGNPTQNVDQEKPQVFFDGTPAATNYGNGGLYAFVRGTDGHLYVNFYNPGAGWRWTDLNKEIAGAPTLAGDPSVISYSGNLYAYFRGTDGHLYVDFYVPGSPTGWQTADVNTKITGGAPLVTGTPSIAAYSGNLY